MRELVYLSERKLSEFRQERRRGFRVREIGVPGVGQVGIEQPADAHLDEVIDYLGGIARWYEEDGLKSGEWVQFEATLSYLVLKQPYSHSFSVLLFADEPGRRRLVLHGSPEHLVGVPTPPVAEVSDLTASFGPNLKMMLILYMLSPKERTLLDRILDFEDPFDPELAAPMTGYARITTAGVGGLVASPLFVAYARQ